MSNRLTYYDPKQKQYIRLASRLAVDTKLGKLEDSEDQIGCHLDVVVKVLEIIKEYQIDVWLLKQCDYETYLRIRKEAMVSVGQIVNENGIILEDEITEEYFDLVKRWV